MESDASSHPSSHPSSLQEGKAPSGVGARSPEIAKAARPVDFVKKVGKGKTLSQDLNANEAGLAFESLLDGRFTPAQAGAFLQALRIKELTQVELDVLAQVFRARLSATPPLPGKYPLVLNLASDTARKGGMASLVAAAALRESGLSVGVVRSAPVLSGNRFSFDRSLELAARFGGDPARKNSPDKAPYPSAGSIVACMTTGDLVRGLASLDDLRGELGFRSCLHTAEKLVNPWPEAPMLLGISHKHYALRMANTMATLGLKGKILLGNHGTVDLVLHKETELVSVDAAGTIREESLSPSDLGLSLATDVYSLARFKEWEGWLSSGSDAGENPLRQVLRYHAAVLLWAAGAAPDPAAGLALALALPEKL